MERVGDPAPRPGRSSSRALTGLVGVAALATAIWAAVVVGVLLLSWAGTEPFVYYSSDAAATFDESPFVGVLTFVRVLILWAAAAASVFAGWAVDRIGEDRRTVAQLLMLGAGLGWLAVDDLFLVHDSVLPRHAGISENVAQLAYVGLAIVLAWWLRTLLRDGEWPLLAVAAALLAPAVLVDVLAAQTETTRAVEDALTLGGFVFLAAFVARLAAAVLTRAALGARARLPEEGRDAPGSPALGEG